MIWSKLSKYLFIFCTFRSRPADEVRYSSSLRWSNLRYSFWWRNKVVVCYLTFPSYWTPGGRRMTLFWTLDSCFLAFMTIWCVYLENPPRQFDYQVVSTSETPFVLVAGVITEEHASIALGSEFRVAYWQTCFSWFSNKLALVVWQALAGYCVVFSKNLMRTCWGTFWQALMSVALTG